MKEKKNILSQTAWWMINKALTKELGIDASLLLSDLLSKFEYFEDRNLLDDDGFFFNTRENIETDTTIPLYRITKAIEVLKFKKLIETNNKGIPPKSRFKLNMISINKLIDSLHNR